MGRVKVLFYVAWFHPAGGLMEVHDHVDPERRDAEADQARAAGMRKVRVWDVILADDEPPPSPPTNQPPGNRGQRRLFG